MNRWVKAKVLEASDRSYSDAVLPLVDGAQAEIVLSLYLVEPDDEANPFHPVNRLLEALLRARRRGVRVRMYLNTKFRIVPKENVGLGKYFGRLLEAGAEVTALLPGRRLHDKLIVIDARYVVEGSTNWSVSALKNNFESDSIIDSPEHARKKLDRIDRLTLPPLARMSERNKNAPLAPLPETIHFPQVLLEKQYLPSLIRTSDRRTLDLYLILLGQGLAAGKSEMEADLETLGTALHLPSGWSRSQVRRQMLKTIRKLQKRYRLLEAEFPFAGNAVIRLKELPGARTPLPGGLMAPEKLVAEESGATFLALAGEVLKKEGVEIAALSAPELERRFGVGASTILKSRKK